MFLWLKAGLDAYFFANLGVGQPSNNIDLSEIKIYLGRIIHVFFCNGKKSGRSYIYIYIKSYFKIHCVWRTLSDNKSLVFFSGSGVVHFCPFWRHRGQEYISKDIKSMKVKILIQNVERSIMYSLYSAHVMSCHCCMFTENYHFKIFGSKWGRNMMITVISGHLSHAQGRWPEYFLFTNLKGRSNGHVTAATAHHHVGRVAPQDCVWNLAKLLSFPDTCKWLWKTNQTIDLCKSINSTCSSKVLYCELITCSRTLVESFVAFLGNREATSFWVTRQCNYLW